MPAFDVTASPQTLSLKAGATSTIVVTVTNRLARTVTARADKVVQPAESAAWIKAPPDPQRILNEQATQEFRYDVVIPPTAAGASLTVRFDVVEVGASDDNFGESNTVAVTVEKAIVKPPPPPPKIPVWVWPLVAVVVIAAGIGIYLATRPKGLGGMPNVVGQLFAVADSTLKADSIAVTRVDELNSDTTRFKVGMVTDQDPDEGSPLKKDSVNAVTLKVQKDYTVVPNVANASQVDAATKLGLAGLVINVTSKSSDSVTAARGLIMNTDPGPGTLATKGDKVNAFVGSFCSRTQRCYVYIMDINKIRAAQATGLRGIRIPPP
ncbi:MAG TPA: PASTA domain-containing protein [Gemmatimonadales bacterium]|nr:PASTA domain-containing protein [Gemmatimonadales bacterium]